MADIEYKGYTIRQDPNDHHIEIYKKKRQVFETSRQEAATDEELCMVADEYIAFATSGIFAPMLDAKFGVRK